MSDSIKYFNALFEPDDIVEMRAIKKGDDDRSIVKNIWCLSKDFTQHTDQCQKYNDDGFGIYIGGNPRNKMRGSKASDVSIARCLFADFDHVTVEEIKEGLYGLGFLQPTLMFFSGHGVHCYWRLTVPMTDMTKWTAVQKRLIATVDSDTIIHDPPRIMRCPGFTNTKPPIAGTYIVESDPTRKYLLADIEEKLVGVKLAPVPPIPSPQAKVLHSQVDKVRRAIAYVAKIPGSVEPGRNAEAQKVGAILMRDFDLTISEAEPIHRYWNQSNTPPLSDVELSKCLTNGEKYGKNPKGVKLIEQTTYKKHTVAVTQTQRPLKMFPRTDAGAAEMLAQTHGEKLRYCYGKGWLYFDGKCWSQKRGEEMARQSCVQSARLLRKEALNAEGTEREVLEKYARRLENTTRITSTLKEAAHTPPMASYADSYDTDNFAFNCLNGTIDLRTGMLRDHCPEDMITICAPVLFDREAKHELWSKVLLEIFQDDLVLIGYVQRVFGMCLTGDVREHVLPILYGPEGRNGKDTVLDGIRGVMGDYAGEAATSLLISKKGFDEHPTEIADLFGKRLVIGSETAEDGKLKAATVKRLTGTKRVKGRFMHQDFFEFDRTFKIMLCTNHRPDVGENTAAIWSRLKIIPFNRVFTESEQDKTLGEKLISEYPGVLNWLIAGCRQWLANGLQEPEAVGEAVAEYKSSQNPLDDFFKECCKFSAFGICPVSILKQKFEEWQKDRGENLSISSRVFNDELRGRGCENKNQWYGGMTQKVWLGIDLC